MRTLALLNRVGIRLSERGLRQPRQRLGLRWTRPRLSLPDKTAPHKATKQGAIAKAILDAPGDTVVGYADQSRLQWLPLRRRMGQWAGKQRRIPTPGSKVTRPLFGALNSFSAQWPYRVRHAARTADFVAFLEYLLNVYPTVPIILIVDHFSSHTAHAVADWLALHPRLPLFYLPLYGSPLNPVETLWLRLKNKLAAHRRYASRGLLWKAVAPFFHDMTPQQALPWAPSSNVSLPFCSLLRQARHLAEMAS